MKRSEKKQKERKKGAWTVRAHLVAFVDLLGVSHSLEAIDNAARNDADYDLSTARVFPVIETFRSSFKDFYEQHGRIRRSPAKGLAGEKQELWRRQVAPKPTIRWFSDCVVVQLPVDVTQPNTFINAFNGLAYAIGAATVTMIGMGTAVRGAVALGFGAEIAGGEIVSAGLVKAYRMEQTEADVPRILVHPDVYGAIQTLTKSDENWLPEEKAIGEALVDYARSLMREEPDGQVAIDYFGPRVLDGLHVDPVAERTTLETIEKSIHAQVRLHSGARGSDKGRRTFTKWAWLKSYWDASVSAARLKELRTAASTRVRSRA